jgi:hypothetical protein
MEVEKVFYQPFCQSHKYLGFRFFNSEKVKWSNPVDFIMTMISFAVGKIDISPISTFIRTDRLVICRFEGLGAVWRFPYLGKFFQLWQKSKTKKHQINPIC